MFTGNGYNPAFFRKGKKRLFTILRNIAQFQDTFTNLIRNAPSQLSTSHDLHSDCRIRVQNVFGYKQGRNELLPKTYECKSQKETVIKKKLVNYDASSLPPTKFELLQQLRRTLYISNIWCNAHMRCPTNLTPEECGWTLIDDIYEFFNLFV